MNKWCKGKIWKFDCLNDENPLKLLVLLLVDQLDTKLRTEYPYWMVAPIDTNFVRKINTP